MDRTIPAIFASGVFRPLEPVDLAEVTQVSEGTWTAQRLRKLPADEHDAVLAEAAAKAHDLYDATGR